MREAEPAEQPALFKPRVEEAALKTRMRQTHKRTWTHTRGDGQAKTGEEEREREREMKRKRTKTKTGRRKK